MWTIFIEVSFSWQILAVGKLQINLFLLHCLIGKIDNFAWFLNSQLVPMDSGSLSCNLTDLARAGVDVGESENTGSPEPGKPLLLSPAPLANIGKHVLCNSGGKDESDC